MQKSEARIQKSEGKTTNSRFVVTFAFIFLFFAFTPPVQAHEGKPHTFHDLWYTWGRDPFIIAGLALAGWLYWRGLRRVWRESSERGRVVRRSEAWAFSFGWLALFVALVSPLHPWGEVLFSAHMTQHEVLMLVAAPLLVLGRPLVPFLWALPARWRVIVGGIGKQKRVQTIWRVLTNPLVAWAIHAIALWVWHAPALFQATLTSDLVHTLQHLSFLGSALLFWWALIHGRRGLMGYGAAVLYMFTTSVHSGVLGALITFAHSVWYPAYASSTASWGLTPLEDQQLGGLIMWIPAGLVYIIAGMALMVGWMRESERRVVQREKRALQLEQQ
ncbi:MAG TPA: cytochrome c oxidase assembly protein [Pyrinomonadaceae bacterium]|jgi:putative membrane protein|nr:cytochrome c oxidase assembly protein [Pyrinomonadaceae bacterium]